MKLSQISCLFVVAVGMWGGSAPAQSKIDFDRPISFEVEDTDVVSALAKLFDQVKIHAILDPTIHGKVTTSLHDVSLETVLQNVFRQVEATFLLHGDTIEIVPRESQIRKAAETEVVPRDIEQDGDSIYIVEGSDLTKLRKLDMKVQISKYVRRRFPKSVLNLSDPKGRDQLHKLLALADVDLVIAPQAKGIVTISEGEATYENAIIAISKSPGQRSRVLDGEVFVIQPISVFLDLSLFGGWSNPESDYYSQTPLPKMTLDKNFIYLVLGKWAYKIRKVDLVTVSCTRFN